MILVIDALNRTLFQDMLADMYRLRGRVFGPRSALSAAPLTDDFDQLNPAYLVHLDARGRLTGCLRLLQTTGPHMLSDALSEVMAGDAPLRSARLWEVSQFCVDPTAPQATRVANTLMTAALEYARRAGVLDLVVLMESNLDQRLCGTGDLAYDYIGLDRSHTIAALLDCSAGRIAALRRAYDLPASLFTTSDAALARYGRHRRPLPAPQIDKRAVLLSWCQEQLASAQTPQDRAAAEALRLELSPILDGTPARRCKT